MNNLDRQALSKLNHQELEALVLSLQEQVAVLSEEVGGDVVRREKNVNGRMWRWDWDNNKYVEMLWTE